MTQRIDCADRHEQPPAFHIMVKPAGASCNLACDYCFYRDRIDLYPGCAFRMPDDILESYLQQLIAAHRTQRVTVAWQGGEPTLMGLDFFLRAVALEKRYARPGMQIERTIQTNGTLLDEHWCEFLRENDFRVGISIDGTRRLHDICRKDPGGKGSFERVINGLKLLQRYGVNYNVLAAVNRFNAGYPLEVYRFFRDMAGVNYLQFIPVMEPGMHGGITHESLRRGQWGNFLSAIFNEWIRRDVGRMSVVNFDGVLSGWLGRAGTICIFGPTCGLAMALEHNGDLYSCYHYVDPDHYLGNLMDTPLTEMVSSSRQRKFGADKRDTLPAYCRRCDYLFLCNGGCPRNRLLDTPEGEPGLNYFCEDYRRFFHISSRPMQRLAALLAAGRSASEILPGPGHKKLHAIR